MTSIIERLRAQVPALKFVAGASSLMAIDENPALATPAAFVIRVSEEITSTPTSGIVIQRAVVKVDLVYQIRNYRDGQRGANLDEEMEALINAGRTALNQWTPTPPTGAQIEAMASKGRAYQLPLRSRELSWLDPFETTYRGTA